MLGKQVCLEVWVKSPLQRRTASENSVHYQKMILTLESFQIKTEYIVFLHCKNRTGWEESS